MSTRAHVDLVAASVTLDAANTLRVPTSDMGIGDAVGGGRCWRHGDPGIQQVPQRAGRPVRLHTHLAGSQEAYWSQFVGDKYNFWWCGVSALCIAALVACQAWAAFMRCLQHSIIGH